MSDAPEVVLEHRCLLGEAPVWDERDGRLVFVDIGRGLVHRWRAGDRAVETFEVGERVSAAAPRAQGGYVLATENGFATLDDATGAVTPIAAIHEDAPGARMNDGKCDPAGRFWAGTQSDDHDGRHSALYRLDADGSVTRVLDGVKSLSYAANMLARRLARERGADDALLVTPHGRVLEAPTSSIFWVKDGAILTPPLEEHILASITRRVVIDETGAAERTCTLDEMIAADEVFLASTIREVHPVAAIDEHRFPAPGPVSVDAAARVNARIRSELAAVR